MEFIKFEALSPWVNSAIFIAGSGLIWFAGSRLAEYAKAIGEHTGAEQAFLGILLLGAVVSLPEMVTTVTAAAMGNAKLAVNILLGGIATTMVVLAITDAVTGGEPLSMDIKRPTVLLQGILVVLFLIIAASGIVIGDISYRGVGVWTSTLLALYLLFIVLVKRYGRSEPWVVRSTPKGRGSSRKTRQSRVHKSAEPPGGRAFDEPPPISDSDCRPLDSGIRSSAGGHSRSACRTNGSWCELHLRHNTGAQNS